MAPKARKRPERKGSYTAMNRALDAAIKRRTGETPKDRQKAFGRIGKRPSGVLAGR
jgi:hypothetical protein